MVTGNSLNADEAGIQTFSTSTGNLTGSTTTQFNVLVGDVNNKIANVAPSATSGIPLVSAGVAANPVFGTAVVAGGGTGNTTFTAFSVICAGTTATGIFQNVSGVGTTGQILTSNDGGNLPSWQSSRTSGYSIMMLTASGSPADATTYFMVFGSSITASTSSGGLGRQKFSIPRTGTITACYGIFTIAGTLGSSENTSVIIRINNTTDVTVTSTAQLTANPTNFGTAALSQAVTAGDFIEFKVATPTWVTNPTTVSLSLTVLIT
jgi:hypothetical protein